MPYPERCLLVHGHFYQPPRENPWTGRIDPQPSAAPWDNWNLRIADECYVPMARSRVRDAKDRIVDLYNNYAHTSFNFGPTLLSWLENNQPRLLRDLRDAATFNPAFAMAQVYAHPMMPLADARDRHTQILWGIREFRHRFGFHPEGMWLPECGICPETIRALVDHRIKFVLLSPHQASRVRPFGEREWRDASMGSVDTRRAYRLFETDGAGRTHFDRCLDVIFYTPGLNLKVSFDHLLKRPDDLARELERCYNPDSAEAQLVSIVTDGEIYGHHEKGGEEALSRLFRDIAPKIGLKVVSAGEFLRDHPPAWEVKLWNGEDNLGSSWSCEHGVGRWYRDCGCKPPTRPGWNQAWRGPLRAALDRIRDSVRQTARRELSGLLRDVDEARDDYIAVVLDSGPESRLAFIKRHAFRDPDPAEVEKLWRILEALHNAMLMYTSCGWFFDELSGLEPVQNMRYALRAAELAQPFHDEDLVLMLEGGLARAQSNLAHYADCAQIFRELVLPSRHSNRELAAAMAVCLAAGFPTDNLAWRLVRRTETVNYSDSQDHHVAWGSFVCHDKRYDRFIKTSWLARLNDFDNSGIVFHNYTEAQGDPARAEGDCPFEPDDDFAWLMELKTQTEKMKRHQILEHFEQSGIAHHRLPEAVRGMLYRRFSGDKETELLEEVARFGAKAVPFLSRARRHGARVPDLILKSVSGAFEQEIVLAVFAAIAEADFGDDALAAIGRSRASAGELGLAPELFLPSLSIHLAVLEMLHWLTMLAGRDWLAGQVPSVLNDGGEWLKPSSPACHGLGYPEEGGLSLAMGKGLAKIREVLLEEPDQCRAAFFGVPLLECLVFARRAGLEFRERAGLSIGYGDFLDNALSKLIAADPTGLMSGEAGDRVRRIGAELGFAEEAVEKKIVAAMKAGMA